MYQRNGLHADSPLPASGGSFTSGPRQSGQANVVA